MTEFKGGRKQVPPWSLLGALVFFLVLWKLDFPKPEWDDLFYNGAALNMAQGGDFSNPLLARQGFPNHYFYMYPPVHSYAVYGWLCVWGVHAASLVAFQNAMYFIIAAGMIMVLRQKEAPEYLSWLVPLGVAAVFLKSGLRPEAFSIALTMLGYAMLGYCRATGFKLWISLTLMILGTIAAPRNVFFGVVLFASGIWEWMRNPSASRNWPRFFIVAGLACLFAGLSVLAMIGFRPMQFYETFHVHATRLHTAKIELLREFMSDLGNRWWPLFLLTALVLGLFVVRRVNGASLLNFGLALAFAISGVVGGLTPASCWYLLFILFVLSAAMVRELSPMRARALSCAVVGALLLANSTKMLEAVGIVTGKIREEPPENREAILALRSTAEHPLLVDPTVARYVFDYKLPSGSLDYGFSAPFPGYVATDTQLHENDIFLLGPGSVAMLNKFMHSESPAEKWVVLGLNNWSFVKHPREAVVVPARSCIERINSRKKSD